jgi:N-acetylmuramoyl-L-alanine amidase-like protein
LAAIAGNDRLPNLNSWYEAVDEYGGGDLYA